MTISLTSPPQTDELLTFCVAFSDTTVKELGRLVKQQLESKMMTKTTIYRFGFAGKSYYPTNPDTYYKSLTDDSLRVLSDLGMAKDCIVDAYFGYAKWPPEIPTEALYVNMFGGDTLPCMVSFSDTTVERLGLLVKEKLVSKQICE